jgi:ergothioneine biosynthesis protein EgtB
VVAVLRMGAVSTPITADSYRSVRALTEAIAAPLSAEDQTAQSMADVSPTKWHRAHTTWFFEEFVLTPNLAGYSAFDPKYRFLFNSYYESVGDRHPRANRGVITRPGIDEVAAYRAHIDAAMDELFAAEISDDVLALVELGLHHEQQHQELALMDIKHVLSQNVLDPVYRDTTVERSTSSALEWIEIDGGIVSIGHSNDGFAFDNESPSHQQFVAPYALASRPVNCGEVLSFIADGGYSRPELWLSDGWAVVQRDGWTAPLYWSNEDGEWTHFTLSGRRPIDRNAPVSHVSYYEADAIARWLDSRLPTEAEWEHAAGSVPVVGNFFDLNVLAPFSGVAESGSLRQMFGDVWEWTASAYQPYPGFRAAPGAVGEYNGKFMVNQQVLRGGCSLTPTEHIRPTYRNFFPPASRWQVAGLRLARDRNEQASG